MVMFGARHLTQMDAFPMGNAARPTVTNGAHQLIRTAAFQVISAVPLTATSGVR
jgi:hypothetical protein